MSAPAASGGPPSELPVDGKSLAAPRGHARGDSVAGPSAYDHVDDEGPASDKTASVRMSTMKLGSTPVEKSDQTKDDHLLVKIGMVGDPGVGKTSLMVRYVEGKFNEDYCETLGVNFLEKTISLPTANVVMSLWDLGGAKEFVSMMPMVCVDAVAMLFLFDLTNRSTLTSIREWYRQVRGMNKSAIPLLIGTKYDIFYTYEKSEQEDIVKQARRFAHAMKAPLIFCSSSYGINVQKLFKIVFAKVFDVKCGVPTKTDIGEPIIEY